MNKKKHIAEDTLFFTLYYYYFLHIYHYHYIISINNTVTLISMILNEVFII